MERKNGKKLLMHREKIVDFGADGVNVFFAPPDALALNVNEREGDFGLALFFREVVASELVKGVKRRVLREFGLLHDFGQSQAAFILD